MEFSSRKGGEGGGSVRRPSRFLSETAGVGNRIKGNRLRETEAKEFRSFREGNGLDVSGTGHRSCFRLAGIKTMDKSGLGGS